MKILWITVMVILVAGGLHAAISMPRVHALNFIGPINCSDPTTSDGTTIPRKKYVSLTRKSDGQAVFLDFCAAAEDGKYNSLSAQ